MKKDIRFKFSINQNITKRGTHFYVVCETWEMDGEVEKKMLDRVSKGPFRHEDRAKREAMRLAKKFKTRAERTVGRPLIERGAG